MKYLFYLVLTNFLYCQTLKIKDTLYLSNGFIDKKYYTIPVQKLLIKNDSIIFSNEVNTPIAYRINLKKDLNRKAFQNGFLFLNKNSIVKVDTIINSCYNTEIDLTNFEYINKFIPFYYAQNNCEPIREKLINSNINDDILLSSYVKENPNSYVALWHLIERGAFLGYSKEREEMLYSFSKELQKSKIWKLLRKDLINWKKVGTEEYFPTLMLRNISRKKEKLKLKKAKYTLIDFWFSSCKPCLEQLPHLVHIYDNYKDKGFQLIGISTDRDKNLSKYENRIKEYNLNWKNYLDENGIESKKLNINKFPTTFLLDSEGKIINKDISPEELEKFLEENL